LFSIWVALDLTTSNPAGAGTWLDLGTQIWSELSSDPDLGRTCLGSQNNTPDETNGVSSAVRDYKELVQFSVSFVTSLFARFLTKLVERQWILYFHCPSNTN